MNWFIYWAGVLIFSSMLADKIPLASQIEPKAPLYIMVASLIWPAIVLFLILMWMFNIKLEDFHE